MSEEKVENTEPLEPEREENSAPPKRRFFSRRNLLFGFGLIAVLAFFVTVAVFVSYRYGVFDNYIKAQFVAKMNDIGIVFDADVLRVTVNPLKLELRNATFNDKTSGEKLFFVREANLGLTVQNLYAWQLSRDISLDSTDINGAEVWVKFDENGKSNFSNLKIVEDEKGSRVNFKYDSLKFTLNDGLVHFGDVQHKLAGNAKNIIFLFSPTTYAVPDEQKRYNFDLTSTDSNFTYDESTLEKIDVRAVGIADNLGAEISEFRLTTPIGESTLSGKLTDWERLQYNFKINSTVDLTQTSTVFPLGTPLRGVGNFAGTVSGEGDKYKVEGEISSDALSASNVYLKGLNVAATVQGTNSMYEANGKAIAELLTFEDFRIEFPKISGNVRGTGTDFKWIGELQAVAAKSPSLSLGGLFISDAVAEYKEEKFGISAGNARANSFIIGGDTEFKNLQTSNIKLAKNGEELNITAPNARADSFKTEDYQINGVRGKNVRVKDRPKDTIVQADNLTAESTDTKNARLKNLNADNFEFKKEGETVDLSAKNLRAENLDADGAQINGLEAANVTLKDVPAETVIFSDNTRIAKITTNAATLGSLNIAGVRLTIRQGRVEATSNNFDAGNVALTKSNSLPNGGTIENVKVEKPVFILEPSGRYRATADMSLGGGVLGSVSLGAARASVTAENDLVSLTNLTADVMQGKVNGNATIALVNSRKSQINAQFSNLDVAKLLALQGGQILPVEGQTTGNVDLTFNGTNFKTASGAINADITANAGTADRGFVPVNGRVELVATDGLFNVNVARLNTEKSELNASGKFDLGGDDSNLTVSLNSTDASEIDRVIRVLSLSPELQQRAEDLNLQFAGNFTFNGNLSGNLSNPTVEGRAELASLVLSGRDVGSIGLGVFISPETIALRDARFQERGGGSVAFSLDVPRTGANNISLDASVDKVNTGTLLSFLPVSLPATVRDLKAKASGNLKLSGLPKEMQGEANITSGAGTLNGEPFDGFDSRVLFAGDLVTVEKFTAKFGDGTLNANGTYNTSSTLFDFTVKGQNVALARVRPFIPNSQKIPEINGTIDLTANATGEGNNSATYNINFNGKGNSVTFNNRAVGDVTFNGTTENREFNGDLTIDFNGQPQKITANVNFADPNLPFRAETNFKNSQLAPFVALFRDQAEGDVEITGIATGKVLLAGNLSAEVDGKRQFTTDNLSGSANFSQLALQIGDTPLNAVEPVSVRFNTSEVVVESARFAGGGSNIVVSGTKALTENGVNNLNVDGSINLSVLNALSRNTFFAGIATVSVRLTGVNATARLNGTADLKNSSVAAFVGAERLTFERLNGRIYFTSNQAQIDDLSGFLGGGRINASGGALVEGLKLQRFRLNLNGTNITVPFPEGFTTTGDADLELTGYREGTEMNSLIRGQIFARRSVYTKDIDLADVVSGRSTGSLSQSDSSSSDSFIGTPKLDISIEGRDALTVRNNVAELTASASLRVTGDTEFPQVTGRITATSGTVFFRNDRYEVQRGELTFPPNTTIEPYINLQAETEIRGYQIIVNLVGDLTNTDTLSANVRSNPALPQADVISLITTGNLANTEAGIPTLAQSGINTAAEILTDSLINNPARKATDKLFGLNVFEIDPIISGQRLNASARLTVGRQINKNLLATYSTNLSQDQNQVLALEYRVSNRLSFVAQYQQRSLSNVTQRNNSFSFEIRLRKRF